MFKVTALITWKAEVPRTERDALMGRAEAMVTASHMQTSAGLTPPSWRGGDLVWHLLFADRARWDGSGCERALDLIEADIGVASVDAAAYPVTQHDVSNAALRNGIFRTLLVAIEPRATREQRREFADDMVHMPGHIPEIVNWAMNEVAAARGEKRWTHVWEQEYARLEDLTGAYLRSPYHLYHVDQWFDPETARCIIEPTGIRHSASELATSVIARY